MIMASYAISVQRYKVGSAEQTEPLSTHKTREMASRQVCNCILFAMMVVITAATTTPRSRRRAPINDIRAITLEELEYACSVQGWTSCYEMTTNLLNSSHSINTFIANCIEENYPYEQPPSPSPSPSPSPTEEGSGILGGLDDGPTANPTARRPVNMSSGANGATGDIEDENKCTVNGEEKKRVRSDVYCKQLFDLDEKLRYLVPYLCLMKDFDCVPYFPDTSYLTPQQIMDSIQLWHEDMISTHKRCCEVENDEGEITRTFTRHLDALYASRVDFSIGEVQSCIFLHGDILWDNGLNKIGLMVHMLGLMQSLGRRKTCLRGCVNEGQVFCTNLLPYVL